MKSLVARRLLGLDRNRGARGTGALARTSLRTDGNGSQRRFDLPLRLNKPSTWWRESPLAAWSRNTDGQGAGPMGVDFGCGAGRRFNVLTFGGARGQAPSHGCPGGLLPGTEKDWAGVPAGHG